MELPKRKPIPRLKGYDYSQDNLYFVTVCVDNHFCCLGEIHDHEMFCNSFGEIMKKQWFWLAEQYSYIKLHAFIVMPNHIHGIVEICAGTVGTGRDPSVNFKGDPSVFSDLADKSRLVPTKVKPLSQIIGAYKTTTSKQIHLEGFTDFKWQRSFYDHIIRDSKSYTMISEYIKENPLRWKEDKFYKTRLIHEWKAHEWGNNFW